MKILQTYLPRVAKLALFALFLLLTPNQLYAGDATFEWTANPEPFTGYKLYYKTGDNNTPPYDGTGLTEGDAPILLDKVTTYTVTGLLPDQTYHFVLTAYSDTEESGYSVIATIYSDPSPTIVNITLQ